MTGEPDDDVFAPTRRAMLAGAGAAAVALLAGCTTYDQNAPVESDPAGPGADDAGVQPGTDTDTAAVDEPGDEPQEQPPLALTRDIPVGGGKVIESQRLVVTQPRQGTFKCFTAICTHQGCTVTGVADGTINCPCHFSKFNIADGSVANGPASRALRSVPITVDGDRIVRA